MLRCLVTIFILAFAHGHSGEDEYRKEGRCSPPIEDGLIVTPFKSSYKHGETIEISCEDGYEIKAKKLTSTCKPPGFFGTRSKFVPSISGRTCEEAHGCRAPLALGLIVTPLKSRYDLGENITISCAEGFERVGPPVHTCKRHEFYKGIYEADVSLGMDSEMSYTRNHFGFDADSACVEIRDCDILTTKGLRMEPFKRTYVPGEEVSISCDDEYELVVANLTICLTTGQFIFQRLYYDDEHDEFDTSYLCRKKKKCMALDYDGVIITPEKPYYLEGDKVTVSCSLGYQLTRPAKSVCGASDHDDDDDDFFDFLDQGSPFTQFGPRIRPSTCTEKAMCEYPAEEGVILTPTKSLYDVGDVISLSCADGYELRGATNSTCQLNDGFFSWISDDAEFYPEIDDDVCEKIPSCKGPGQQHGLVVSQRKKNYYEGDELQFSCEEGFTLVGPESAVCTKVRSITAITTGFKKLKFKPSLPKKLCKRIPTCEPPRRPGMKYSPKKPHYGLGDTVALSCEEGYEFTGEPSERVVECSKVISLTSIKTGFKAMRFRPRIPRNVCKKIEVQDSSSTTEFEP